MAEMIFTDSGFAADVLKEKGLVMVDFFAPWCGPCRMMAPIVEKLVEEYAGKAKIGKMDIDENQATAQQYGIQSIPTVIFFRNGEAIDKLVGFQSAENLKKKLDTL
jgi:thioredoxin 1